MTLRPCLFALLITVAPLGCGGTPTQPLDLSNRPAVPAVNASIRFLNLEGGCWTIAVADDHYLPFNLPVAFQQDGLAVRVEFRQRDDYGSVCMVGPVVEILSIQSR